jgi:hypothetical protein
VVVLGGTDTRPYEISAVEPKALRALTDHNAFLADKALGPAPRRSGTRAPDGTPIEALLVRPPGFARARNTRGAAPARRPVYQFSHEFLPDFQALAARATW